MANQLNKDGVNIGISWCDATANLWWGCTKVHEGCDNCYAETFSKRFNNNLWGNENPRKEIVGVWKELNRLQSLANKNNKNIRVFVGSMMDVFEKPMSMIDAKIPEYTTGVLRARLFDQISDGWYPNLIFLFLTKRPSNINKYIPETWKLNPPKNVWFGTSVVNQDTANKLIPQLLQVKGNKFLSIEPQLGEITLRWAKWHDYNDPNNAKIEVINGKECLVRSQYDGVSGINWIIQGGESGNNKRPFNIKWAELMKEQCKEANIAYFFKQIDKIQPIPEHLKIQEFPNF